jgi:4-diphosphocytidyl-2-C-methyl-D-erythritol kinase
MLKVRQHDGRFEVETPAKINVGLTVLGKRPDGYHEIESLVVAIGLTDLLEGRPEAEGEVRLTVESKDGETPADESNLVMKAARLLQRQTGTARGAALRLVKKIPVGRGLGGGSSDAAAALVLLNEMWKLKLSPEKLAELGASLGSDVAFFLGSPVAIMRGRGEVLEPRRTRVRGRIILLSPPFGLPTKDVYSRVKPGLTPGGGRAILYEGWLRGGDFGELGRQLVNDLEAPARSLRSEMAELREALEKAGAGCVSMTGSGSAVYALVASEEEAKRVMDNLRLGAGVEVHLLAPWEAD